MPVSSWRIRSASAKFFAALAVARAVICAWMADSSRSLIPACKKPCGSSCNKPNTPPKALGGVLGLLQEDPQGFLQAGISDLDESAIQAQITARATAKAAKNFAEADRIRQELTGMGIVLKDSPTGTKWERA